MDEKPGVDPKLFRGMKNAAMLAVVFFWIPLAIWLWRH